MTPEEKNMLADLAAKISQTPAPPRDPEAEDFIRKNIGSRPDALYIMTQTVLIQNMALHQAQQQIQQLQERSGQSAPAASSGQSFLGGQAQPSTYQQPTYQQQSYSAPPPPQYAPAPQSQPSRGSSFLQNAAQTAAGVAAGTLAVQGIESLFHGGEHMFGGGYGYGGGFGGPGFYGGGGAPVEENVVNNYYDNSGGGGDYRDDDRRDDYDASAQDDSNYDDNSVDDASYDDNSGGDGGDNFV